MPDQHHNPCGSGLARESVSINQPPTQKRHDCRKNDLFTLNANPENFSVERVFSLVYVRFTPLSRLVAGLRFFTSNEALACGFHPLLSESQGKALLPGIFITPRLKHDAVARM
jgi:hypothetical protein